jgi:hypothetical protein
MNVRLKLVFSEEKKPYLLDITSLLYDFELLHDFSLILWADDYSDYKFSRFFLYRNKRPIKANHKIRAVKIIKESPLIIVIEIAEILALTGALSTMLLLIEKIRNWRLNREKLMYEVKKLKLETEKLSMELEQKLLERNAANILNSLLHRLESNPIKLEDVEAYVEEGNKNEKVTFT